MKTFKVIEEGRILTADELGKVDGGICFNENSFRNCHDIPGTKVACLSVVSQPCANQLITECAGFYRYCVEGTPKHTCPPYTEK